MLETSSRASSEASRLTRGYGIAVIAAVVLSSTGIFIRYLTQTYHMPALVLAMWRDVFASFTLLVSLSILRPAWLKVERRHLPYLLIYGFVLACFNSLWTLSVSLNGAAVSTVLAYCSAGFTALLGWWFLKESLDWGKILAVILSLAGCALISGALDPAAWRSNLLGILTGILSGLFYAIYSLMGRSAVQRGIVPWTSLFYIFSLAAFFLLLFNLFLGGILPGTALQPADLLWLGNAWPGWVILFVLAAGPTVAGYGLYNVSMVYLPSSVANLIVTLEPAFTAVVAYFLLGERFTAVQVGGSLLILAGVVFLRVYEGWLAGRSGRLVPEVELEPGP
jgi:drug/metabolite transporter (DMT)-like permease